MEEFAPPTSEPWLSVAHCGSLSVPSVDETRPVTTDPAAVFNWLLLKSGFPGIAFPENVFQYSMSR